MCIEVEKGLKDLLSYELDKSASYYSGNWRTKRCLLTRRGEFPSGLLYLVQSFLGREPHAITDLRKIPQYKQNLFTLKMDFHPYPEQVTAVKACKQFGRGTVSAVTGFGKSITMALLVDALKVKTLIIVPNLGLKRQLQDSFKQLFGDTEYITIENIDSRALETATGYDCLIIDEAHHSAAATYRKLNKKAWTGIYHRFFFTATPFRSNKNENLLLESIVGQVIYQVSYKTAVEKGYIVPVEAYYYELPKSKVEGYSWASVYSEIVVNNKERNALLSDILVKLHANKASTLCLVKEIRHGENISNITKGAFASGEDPEECKQLIHWFNQKSLTCLIGTTGVLGEGVDTRPAEYIIIAGLGKSKNSIMQQIGRGVRRYPGKESCKVILFKDPSHKWSRAHFREQCKIMLDQYGVVPIRL